MPVVFFDIGDTLAIPILSASNHLEKFTVLPKVKEVLEALKAEGIRIGIISNPGNESPTNVKSALQECGLLQFIDENLLIFGSKDSPAIFMFASQKANEFPDQCIFVGENSSERSFAIDAGFLRVSPHPTLAESVIKGAALFYACIKPSTTQQNERWLEIRNTLHLVPIKITGNPPQTYVIAAIDAIDSLRKEKIELKLLGGRDDPLQTDMYLVRDDRPTPPGFSSAAENSRSFLAEKRQSQFIVDHSKEGVYVALPSNVSIERIHFPFAHHGHNEKLIPDNSLFIPFKPSHNHVEFDAEEPPGLSNEEIDAINSLTVSSFTKYHRLYAGIAQLENAGLVTSRHIRHPDNQRVVDALQRQFTEIGGPELIVSRHRFPHENIFLDNVVAEFSGTEPESFVLVTAHLDSTAAFGDGPYNPANDPAPGSDDDASGIAAVLAIAEVIAKARQTRKAKRSIRFVLFNAEEHGLVGSKAYARRQASLQTQITAVFQMDMIGYKGIQNSTPHQFEVHVGFFPSEDVEQRSFLLANIIQQIAQTVSPLLGTVQVYPAPNDEDPADGRSDHAPFQEHGYAACVISEDFFAGPSMDSPEETPNPDYHKPTDLTIDYEYATSIARIVAAAALIAANV